MTLLGNCAYRAWMMRLLWHIATLIVVVVSCPMAGARGAGREGRQPAPYQGSRWRTTAEAVEARVFQSDFDRFCARLELDAGQLILAAQVFREYQTRLTALDRKVNDVILRATRTQVLSEAWQVWRSLDTREALALRRKYMDAHRSTRDESMQLIDALVNQIHAILIETQTNAFEYARLGLRRDVLLNPTSDLEGPDSIDDLGVNVDLVRLVEAASVEDGELTPLFSPSPPADATDELLDARKRAQAVLAEYIDTIDQIIGGAYAWLDNKYAITESGPFDLNDRERARRYDRAADAYVLRIYHLNYLTAARIEQILRERSLPTHAARWNERVHRAHYPHTHRQDRVDRFISAVLKTLDDDAPLRRDLTIRYDAYWNARAALRATARQLMFDVQAESMKAFGEFMEHPKFHELVENMGQRERLEEETLSTLTRLVEAHSRTLTNGKDTP